VFFELVGLANMLNVGQTKKWFNKLKMKVIKNDNN
jgi:hypothetical protein